MLTKLHLKNFKGFRDTEVPALRKVNLIVGGQNVGKTSLLEAVVFAAGDTEENKNSLSNLPQIFRPNEGADSVRFWTSLIGTPKSPIGLLVMTTFGDASYLMGGYANDESVASADNYFQSEFGKVSSMHVGQVALQVAGLGRVDWIHGVKSDDVRITLRQPASLNRTELETPESFPVFPMSAIAQVSLYGQLVTRKRKKAVVELLKKIEPRLESIDAVAPDGEHRVYADLSDGEVLPLSQLGHGFTRLFELYSGLAVTESKLALIDEIENGVHYSALPTLFQGIRELADSNGVQSIITTHSLEAIKAACEVFKDRPEDFQLIRLERTDDDNIRAVAINDENLKVVMASGWEMR